MKNLNEIAFIVQARLNSQRVPQKMIRPFARDTLFGIVLDKLLTSSIIPKSNIFASVHEQELIDIANSREINIWERSYTSANSENSLQEIYEWHDQLPAKYKYVVLISGCNPLLTIKTIDEYVNKFVNQIEENLFAVIEKKTYYWNKDGQITTYWPPHQEIMNTKDVEPTYEAAHCLYASRLDLIKENKFMVDFKKENLILHTIPELESFDIDYEWQFKIAEKLYGEV